MARRKANRLCPATHLSSLMYDLVQNTHYSNCEKEAVAGLHSVVAAIIFNYHSVHSRQHGTESGIWKPCLSQRRFWYVCNRQPKTNKNFACSRNLWCVHSEQFSVFFAVKMGKYFSERGYQRNWNIPLPRKSVPSFRNIALFFLHLANRVAAENPIHTGSFSRATWDGDVRCVPPEASGNHLVQ